MTKDDFIALRKENSTYSIYLLNIFHFYPPNAMNPYMFMLSRKIPLF